MLQNIRGRIQNKTKFSYAGNTGLGINFADGSRIFMTINDVLPLRDGKTLS